MFLMSWHDLSLRVGDGSGGQGGFGGGRVFSGPNYEADCDLAEAAVVVTDAGGQVISRFRIESCLGRNIIARQRHRAPGRGQ